MVVSVSVWSVVVRVLICGGKSVRLGCSGKSVSLGCSGKSVNLWL